MSAPGLVRYAWSTYGRVMQLDDAEQFRNGFFELYSQLPVWHRRYKRLAQQQKFIRNPLGRVRHLPLIHSSDPAARHKEERRAINSPVQSTLSDMGQLAMVELDYRYPDLWMFGFVHDATEMYVPIDDVPLWAGRVREVAENLPLAEFGWHPQLSFPIDVEVGDSLATCKNFSL